MLISRLLENIGWKKKVPSLSLKIINLKCTIVIHKVLNHLECSYKYIIENIYIYYDNQIIYERKFFHKIINNEIFTYYCAYNNILENNPLFIIINEDDQLIFEYKALSEEIQEIVKNHYSIESINEHLIDKVIQVNNNSLIIKKIILNNNSLEKNEEIEFCNIYCEII